MAGRKLYNECVDMEKAFNCVPRKVIWWAIEREVLTIEEMDKNIETHGKIDSEQSKEFGYSKCPE